MPSIQYTTSADPSRLEHADGDLRTVGDLKSHIIQKYNVRDAVVTKGSKFRIPVQDTEMLQTYTLKPVKVPTLFHAELI